MTSIRIRIRSVALASLLALTVVGTLAACDPGAGPADPTPSGTSAPSPTATPTPTGEPEPEFGVKPGSRYDVDCEDLADTGPLASVHAAAVAPTDPFATALASDDGIPTAAVVLQLGGLACEWTNGAAMIDNHQVSNAFVGTTINVIPDAATQWAKWVDTYGVTGDSALNCYSTSAVVNCDLNEFRAGSWIEVTTYNVNAPVGGGAADFAAAIAPLLDGVRHAIDAATVSPATVVESPFPIPTDCGALITGDRFGAVLGIGPTIAGGPHGGWSLGAGARVMAGAKTCIYFYPSSDLAAGSVSWLPNGAWAAEAGMAVATFPSTARNADLAGPDASWVRYTPDNGQSAVDVAVNGNWVHVSIWDDDTYSLPAPADRWGAALEVMRAILPNVGS